MWAITSTNTSRRPASLTIRTGRLFRTTGRSTGTPHRLTQQDAYRLIQRYAKRAGIKTQIGNHTMRAEGSLSEARKMANHADTRTTQLYDRRSDAASLDEYQKEPGDLTMSTENQDEEEADKYQPGCLVKSELVEAVAENIEISRNVAAHIVDVIWVWLLCNDAPSVRK